MNADGNEVKRVSPADAADYSPAWSPNGEWLACASGNGNPGGTDLYVMFDGEGETQGIRTDADSDKDTSRWIKWDVPPLR